MNALAVEIAAREGARTVWLPTVDSVNESHEREAAPGTKVPVWVKLQLELREQGIEIEPVPVVDDEGTVLPGARPVLATVARHGMVLATGHLGRAEIFAMVDAALEEGVRDIVITHPEFPSQNLSVEDQCELADRGALLERCFTTPHTGKVTWERWIEHIRATGARAQFSPPTWGRSSTRPWRMAWPRWSTGCWMQASTRRRCTRWRL